MDRKKLLLILGIVTLLMFLSAYVAAEKTKLQEVKHIQQMK